MDPDIASLYRLPLIEIEGQENMDLTDPYVHGRRAGTEFAMEAMERRWPDLAAMR